MVQARRRCQFFYFGARRSNVTQKMHFSHCKDKCIYAQHCIMAEINLFISTSARVNLKEYSG